MNATQFVMTSSISELLPESNAKESHAPIQVHILEKDIVEKITLSLLLAIAVTRLGFRSAKKAVQVVLSVLYENLGAACFMGYLAIALQCLGNSFRDELYVSVREAFAIQFAETYLQPDPWTGFCQGFMIALFVHWRPTKAALRRLPRYLRPSSWLS